MVENEKLTQEQKEFRDRMFKKIFTKNRREITRLEKHAKHCLITNNKDGYIYAIGKLRKIVGKGEIDQQTAESLWLTSKERLDGEILKILKQGE